MTFNWSPKSPEWKKDTLQLLLECETTIPEPVSFQEVVKSSLEFPIKFPVDTGRCECLKQQLSLKISQSTLERNINSAYPVIHENALELYANFLLHKREYGSNVEKNFYRNMGLSKFIDRLLKQRAVMFMGRFDKYKLLNGATGSGKWDTIGKSNESPPLLLKDCISYDEIKLSTFLSVSSYSYFVNIGDRKNFARYSKDRVLIEDEGVIIGLIGPRLKKANVMEYEEIIINERQNTTKNGYGTTKTPSMHHLFSEFYEEECLDFNGVVKFRKSLPEGSNRYIELKDSLFDNLMYYKRMAFPIDVLLIEANERAKAANTTAYIHVVGLGLGVWKASPHQENEFMDAFGSRIKVLEKHLNNVSDICFSYIKYDNCNGYKNRELFKIDTHPLKGIRIHIFKRDPHERLKNEHAGKLLIVSYAWDGNALPGNEFWAEQLGSSGDSAAASSTQIAELHNPHINPKVCASNLRVVTQCGQVVDLKKYIEDVRSLGSKRKSQE